ncbi:Putative type II secretion system protein E [Aquisphaera giovannonii]|uniref:Type II secretion system protein E n=1 Tax=Aquisphaera giovannonii TaxID=406548 RepID=A0A5B9W7U6_9BACT|nr:GspE/PulE family protein [Aquisphaera giovannonii]QEH36762.1 Putative type II secretion system protein E [Aquisphaera giovannonii]
MDSVHSTPTPPPLKPAVPAKQEGWSPAPGAPPLSPEEEALVHALIRRGLVTSDQLRTAQQYGVERGRDLRQAILEMNLISPELLNQLAFERLAAIAGDAPGAAGGANVPVPTGPAPLSPDRTQHHRDIRKELQEMLLTAPLPEVVAQILDRAFECRATDIHFDSQETGLRVRFRIDGQLQDILFVEPQIASPMIGRLKVMANLNIVERRHAQDGRISLMHHNRPRDLRLATFPTIYGEKIVIRIHEVLTSIVGFTHLGMSQHQAELIDRLVAQPYGAVLVAGPVGAGKTSTLYNCLERINSPLRNVMTIEDPIEHRIPGVNQTQVNTQGEMGFGEGLRAMLRQDPDVIMIGEIRDDETARIGIRAALTGVLVFSTLHGSDSPSTISNLYNFGIPGYQLSSSILAIISQRLIRRICPYCRVTFPADEKVLVGLELDPDEHRGLNLHRGLGCPACFQTGYMGRTGIFEIMVVGEELRDLMFQQIPKDVLRRVAVDLGMRTLKQSAVDKILDGTTTVEEVYRVVSF